MTQMTQLKWKIVKWKVSEKLLKSQNFAILVKIFNLMLAMRLNGVHLGNLLRDIVKFSGWLDLSRFNWKKNFRIFG